MIRALIVDDERLARKVMRKIITDYAPEVEIVGECSNVPDAVLEIGQKKPDVVFLDIEMPEYSGFQLLSFFNQINFEIIFVTAYSEYAVKAFEVSAVDYILKPVQIDHLKKAIVQLKDKLTVASMQGRLEALKANLEEERIKKIVIPMIDGIKYLKVNDIAFIQAKGSYGNINFKDGTTLLTSKSLRFFEDTLADEEDFKRVHRSTIVNMSFVSTYNKGKSTVVFENNQEVAVSASNKSLFDVSKTKGII